MDEKIFISCQDDLGNYEIRYDDKVFHFLWEVVPILNEQQATNDYLEEANSRLQMQLGETLRLVDEQQVTISALKDIFKDIFTYSQGDSEKSYYSLRIAVDKKTYYKIRRILNE